ncbi:leucine-rich repeat-containing protein let-4-like [Anopheles ziemanni]|uniref:leucine-rich repeat-containing protein let-4-like n=1 Tax=Anopheles coustani TaxID=139045 RepID=UPI0026587E26|nr:leucine-rich repeat-containing protein let-4-like [Anopheles coustani]XP_058178113.1 leucine-rich repeat-containing protein let-4-like [Anopheles ziemanni]
MSAFTAELTFRKYYERVFYTPRDTEIQTIVLVDAPVLQEIQIQPNSHIRDLNIYNTGLSQIPQGLKYLTRLNGLYASKNQFTQFTLASFSSTQRLSRMDLSDNKINLLVGTNHTVSIETLNMAVNRLTTVDMSFFGQIANLSVLNLMYNQIIRVESTIPVKLQALEQLMLSNNRLTSFQPQPVSFPVLNTLSLGSNNLSSIPRNLVNYPSLKSLDLGKNKLTCVDLSSIRQAKKLDNLNLDRNVITSLSSSSPLKHDALRVLSANDNELVQFTHFTLASFSSTQRLSSMDLSDNKINLLVGTNHTVSIEAINMAYNRLTSLDMSFFGQIANLTILDLYNNQIIRVDSTFPVKFLTLKKLYLTNNRLTSFQPQAVSFPELRMLSLGSNNLTSIPRNLVNYATLEFLDLGKNKLTDVDLSSIRQAKKLIVLDLNENKITSLSASSPLKHDALEILTVNSNELVQVNFTGCAMASFVQIMSTFTKDLTIRKYYDRVFYTPRDTEVETVALYDAHVLQEIQIQPNSHV